jgi:hypothetical protein
MSSLNITDLYDTINNKNKVRMEKFDMILKRIHSRIKYNANLERTFCFFQIPEFIIGIPLYNVNDLRNYLINSLKKNGFTILYVEPNWLFINWDFSLMKKPKKQVKKSPKKDYKLIDEYKPSGNFINEENLMSIRDKSKQLF